MIAAVVVTFSAGSDVLDRCLRSLVDAGGLGPIFVIDTGGAAEIADDLHDRCRLIPMDNLGYGAAANLGFRHAHEAGADVVALLNDDVVALPGWVEPLAAAVGGDVGAGQPVLVTHDRTVVASLGVAIDRYGAGTDVGDGHVVPSDREPRPIDIFTGGAVVLSSAFVRSTGGFDERMFLYYEDVDLARRGAKLGWRYLLVPKSLVEHERGTSTRSDADQTRFYQERNRLLTAVRHGAPVLVIRAFGLSVRRLRHRPRSVHSRALLHGLVEAPSRLLERVRRRNQLNV